MRVFITGASSGLGAQLARCYAAEGATLGLLGRDSARLQALAASLNVACKTYVADVADAGAMCRAADDFMQAFGAPDLVIANAGISVGTLTEISADIPVFARVFDTNVMGVVHTLQPFVHAMKERGSGTLAGISSVAGIRGLPGSGAYSASKAAVTRYLESLRLELRKSGVRVCTVAPGYIDTPMTAVNRFPMPFRLPVETAALRIKKALRKQKSYVTIPWQMAIVSSILKLLPNVWYDALFSKAPHKPRNLIKTSS